MLFVESPTHLSIKNILLTTVISEPSKAILSYTFGFARHHGSKMSLTGAASPQAICEIVRKREIDFIVVGTPVLDSRSELHKAVGDLLRMVPCPMLVIGPKVRLEELTKGDREQLVYVTDFTSGSLEALPYAIALARDYGAPIKFIHVAEEAPTRPSHFGNSRIVAFRKRLESLLDSVEGLPQESEFVVQEGDRVEGLVTIAANLHASLIVMSARGVPERAAPCLMWPIATQVVCRAHSPVLIARGVSISRKTLVQ